MEENRLEMHGQYLLNPMARKGQEFTESEIAEL